MDKNKATKYLKYAIGEIILVVIGILIAIQINNLNERRKENILAEQYLRGIHSDLKKDLKHLDRILQQQTFSINLINSIENNFMHEIYQPEKYSNLFITPDTTKFQFLFHRGTSFRSIGGTYNSLISEGQSGIIKNRALFQEIQVIYDELNQRAASIYQTLKDREGMIIWAYSNEKKHWTFSDLKNAKNEKIYLDLSNFTEQKYFYSQALTDLKWKMLSVINLLENEIE